MSWRWRFSEDAPEAVRTLTESWEQLDDLPGAATLKANALRSVVALPEAAGRPPLINKRYKLRSLAERLRFVVAPSRAEEEWRALRRLRSGGVSVPAVFAVGELRSGLFLHRAGLILERVPDTVHLNQWLVEAAPEADLRVTLLRQLGEELANLHGCGARHPDLHAGNVLVQQVVGGAPRLWLIDHHACRFGAPPREERRRSDLAKLFHSMAGAWTHDDGIELLRGYRAIAATWTESALPAVCEELQQRARRLESRRLRSRSKRCWLNSTDFAREANGGWRWHRRKVFPAAAVDALRNQPLAFERLLHAGEAPSNRRTRVGIMKLDGLQADNKEAPQRTSVVVKELVVGGFLRSLWHAFVPTALEHAWGAARAFEVRELPTPQSLALLVEGRWLPRRVLLVTRFVSDGISVREHIDATPARTTAAQQRQEVDRCAALVRDLHDYGLYHRDLNPSNILKVGVGADAQFVFVDLDAVRVRAHLSERRRTKNLVQLGASPGAGLSPADRRRFLWRYDRGEGRYWSRDFIQHLDRCIGDALVATIGKFSRFEQQTRTRELRELAKLRSRSS
ncbi:MAG: lipopolysaccharide kinase InaA family protein [Planctomycetota bacterium]